MLKIKRWLKVVASLKVLQDPIKQLGMAAVRTSRSMKVHQLTPVRNGREKWASYDLDDQLRLWNLLYPQTRQQREYLRGADPLPRVNEFTAELLGALNIKTLRPSPLNHLLQSRD